MRFSAPRSIAAGTVVLLLLVRVPLLFDGLWWDEAYTVQVYGQDLGAIRDPEQYLPNNHLLFSYVAWFVRSLVGPLPWALRLAPFAATVVAVVLTGVLVRRHLGPDGALAAMLLVVASPTVLELSVQARGYGFGFLAIALVLLGADALLRRHRLSDEAVRRAGSRPAWALLLGLAAFAGVATLPQLALAVAGVGIVVVLDDRARWLGGGALVAAAVAGYLFYEPLIEDLVGQSGRVGTRLAETATIPDLVILPAVGAVAAAFGDQPTGTLRTVAVLVGLVLLASGAWRWWQVSWRRAALLAAPVLVTVAGFVVLESSTLPRYTSFLAVPLAALVAGALAAAPPRWQRGLLVVLAAGAFAATVVRVGDHVRRPQEEVAAVVGFALDRGVEHLYLNRSPGHVTFRAALDRAGRDLPITVSDTVPVEELCAEVAAGRAAFVDYPYERDAVPGEVPDCVGPPDLELDQRLEPGRIAVHVGTG